MNEIELQKLIAEKAKECRYNGNNYYRAACELKEKYPHIVPTVNALRKRIRKQVLKSAKGTAGTEHRMFEENKDKGTLDCRYVGKKQITSEEGAIAFFGVDTERWEAVTLITNSWDVTAKDASGQMVTTTNYQVKITFRKKEKKKDPKAIKAYFDSLGTALRQYRPGNTGKGTSQVACFADLHYGARTDRTKGVLNTPDVSPGIIGQRLARAAQELNAEPGPVTVCLLGDLIESFTGLNHLNTWNELESWGAPAVIGTAELLATFFRSIRNFHKVHIISGNHDRITAAADHDQWGQAAAIVSYMLEKSGFEVHYHPLVQKVVVDDIVYIITHGDKLRSGKPEKLFFEYGEQGKYNVLVSGHTHNRSQRRSFPLVEIKDMHLLDSRDYRAVTVAPVFTGNFWAESKGFTGTAGFSRFRANRDRDNIYHHDIPL